MNSLGIASILLDQKKPQSASAHLLQAKQYARQYGDMWSLAETQRLFSCMYTLSNDILTAHSYLLEAIDLFERMGMRRELAEAREELARLEAQMAEAAE